MSAPKQSSKSKPPKEFPGQHPGETVELVFRQHPVVMRRQLIYGMLAILVGLVPLMLFPLSNIALQIFLATPVLIFLYWFFHWVGWYYSVYIITDQRLIDIQQKGFFNRKVSEVGFEKVQSINYHIKGIEGALLKFGDIAVQTYSDVEWKLPSIHHPEYIHAELMDMTHKVSGRAPRASTGS
jgi:uncharacterized membrane protein YdbT with pleckstrin-like domain